MQWLGIIFLVGVTTAFAAGGGEEDEGDNESPALKGSIAAPKENGSDNEAVQELQKLAKMDRSRKGRSASGPGTVKSAKLDDDNGYVVCEVEVASLSVTAQNNLNPGGVLPVALGVPMFVGTVLFVPVFWRRRRFAHSQPARAPYGTT